MEYATSIATLLQSISVIFASLSIALGVNAWRREHIGKRRIELAEDVLTAFYEARDAIRRIRSPFGFVGEGSTRKKGESEGREEAEILDRAYVVHERFNKERELFNRLHTMRYRMAARFSTIAEKPFNNLESLVREIFFSAERLGSHYWQRQGRVAMTEDERTKHLKEMHEHERVFWSRKTDDPVEEKLVKIIAEIEAICRPAIQEHVGLAGLLTRRLK
jgi:hypothetical protein